MVVSKWGEAPEQLTFEHEFQVVANRYQTRIKPLFHLTHVVDRVQKQRLLHPRLMFW